MNTHGIKIGISIFLTFIAFAEINAQKVKYKKLGIEKKSVAALRAFDLNDQVPDFEFDLNGKKILLSDYVKQQPVVLVFYRGHWCPICDRHLSSFQEDLFKLENIGLKALAIAPQTDEYIEEMIEETELKIPVISDEKGEIMLAYKLAFAVTEKYQRKIKTWLQTDIAETNGMEDAFLPIPATYIIGENMEVRYVHFDPKYSNRASIDDIIEAYKANGY